ncbi:hypothetical protein I3700191H1_02500 [Megasphaera massiliensis]
MENWDRKILLSCYDHKTVVFKVLVSDVGSELPTQGKLSGNYDLLYGAIFVLLIRDE